MINEKEKVINTDNKDGSNMLEKAVDDAFRARRLDLLLKIKEQCSYERKWNPSFFSSNNLNNFIQLKVQMYIESIKKENECGMFLYHASKVS
jgi:hypothetical protein